MTRILGIELRRSAAAGTALVLLVVGTLLLYLAAEGSESSTAWLHMAMTQRLFLAVLWPLALAAGAWQARREHRSNVAELFASTPRPLAQRIVPTLVAMAVAVVCGYLAMAVAGGVRITGSYLAASTFAVVAVGVLSLIAAVWLGLAVGRLLPSPVTAPALAVAGLALLLLIPGATRPRGWLALVFSPIYEMNMPGAWQAVPGRASAAQAVWFVALAGAAVLLYASRGRTLRIAALLPLVAGAALAIVVMPHQNRYVNDAIDPVAQELVCADGTPKVCVSRVHSGLLDDVTAPARKGLELLAKVPGAPTAVHEDTTTYFPERYAPWAPDVVLLNLEMGMTGRFDRVDEVTADVVAGAFNGPPGCENRPGIADGLAAAAWLAGTEPVAGLYTDPADVTAAAEALRKLRDLPDAEAQARVAALLRAASSCTGGEGLLAGGKQ